MIRLETSVTKVLLLQLRGQEDSLLEEAVQMVSLLVTSDLVDPPISVKLEMLVCPIPIRLLQALYTHLPFSPCRCRPPRREPERHFRRSGWS